VSGPLRLAAASLLAASLAAIGAATASAASNPYFSARFEVRRNPHTFGQDPTWTRDGDVLSVRDDEAGILQVHRSRLSGAEGTCLTCGQPGPNGFAAERSQGDWILFASYRDQPLHFGKPGLGGYGGDLYVMRRDGSRATRLTTGSAVPYDNFHPYWSPDGRHVVWTRTRAFPLSAGGQTWEMVLGDFVAKGGRPHLANVRVVGPAYGAYETQAWAPDGSGFLFSAFGPRRSPYQAKPPGWMHMQLYFMRLYGRGASPGHPRVTLLTDELPAYQEQAVFTPDMRDVIMMSNRNTSGSWYSLVIAAAQRTRFDAPFAGSAGTLQFLADFNDPAFSSDLYMLDIRTHALRQLTDYHHVIPEFGWNRRGTKLLWSEAVDPQKGTWITRVASFPGITARQRRPSGRVPAPGLSGHPIRMSRVTARAAGGPPARRVPQNTRDVQGIPSVVPTYLGLWLSQLEQLGEAAGIDLAAPTLLRAPASADTVGP
jgi:Tol biopolymer transport system component